MRSALHGWTWTLQDRGAQSTVAAIGQLGIANSTNDQFMILEGLLWISILLKVLPLAERFNPFAGKQVIWDLG
jgi:hypothetical protein